MSTATTVCEYTIEGNPDGPTLVFIHGWPDNASLWRKQVAALDIGGHLQPGGIKEALKIVGYQWALVFCWLVGGIVPPPGNWLSKGVAKVIRVPSRQRANFRSRYNYPYFYLRRNTLLPW